jgi:hypothetical protein
VYLLMFSLMIKLWRSRRSLFGRGAREDWKWAKVVVEERRAGLLAGSTDSALDGAADDCFPKSWSETKESPLRDDGTRKLPRRFLR